MIVSNDGARRGRLVGVEEFAGALDGDGDVRLMSGNGAQRLRWTGRVLAVDDLRRHLNGHRELLLSPRTVVTPLAADELRARGVASSRTASADASRRRLRWGYRPGPAAPAGRRAPSGAGARGRRAASRWRPCGRAACRWAQAVAECVARGECCGGVVFCDDPGLVCCVANKVPGLRAVAVATVGQAARATLTLGANLLAVEMPGRTFFEMRQILRTLCCDGAPALSRRRGLYLAGAGRPCASLR